MQLFIVDAFTDHIFGGNQAGVALLRVGQPFPNDALMQKIAAELKHSETAFVRREAEGAFLLRYFTPEGEVPLCGHATVSAFTVLRHTGEITCGEYLAKTQSGDLRVMVEPDKIWLQMPRGELLKTMNEEETARVYRAYGLTSADQPDGMCPAIAKVGLADILLPVGSKHALDHVKQSREEVITLSKELNVVGVHMYFCPRDGAPTAYCRNFAPLFGIDEESATGTSNASLTHYLNLQGRILPDAVNTIAQGDAMGKPSTIYSKVDEDGAIWIGGSAVISIQGELKR
ncbi:MAG: PhzF family phenazine biosynthesis protein [Eubacteriales bacterium]|nr:PhzF family phenazine biosynthesis protein [Eubacteriales bacterium]